MAMIMIAAAAATNCRHSDRKSIYAYEANPEVPSLFRAKYKVPAWTGLACFVACYM